MECSTDQPERKFYATIKVTTIHGVIKNHLKLATRSYKKFQTFVISTRIRIIRTKSVYC